MTLQIISTGIQFILTAKSEKEIKALLSDYDPSEMVLIVETGEKLRIDDIFSL